MNTKYLDALILGTSFALTITLPIVLSNNNQVIEKLENKLEVTAKDYENELAVTNLVVDSIIEDDLDSCIFTIYF